MGPTRSLLAGLALLFGGCVSATTPDDGTRRHIAELEEEDVELHAERAALGRRFGAVLESVHPPSGEAHVVVSCPGCLACPAIDAVVIDVRPELELVVLDKGKQDGVKVGYSFTVYLGTIFKGIVHITDVQEGTSTGSIRSTKAPILRGDSATTVL